MENIGAALICAAGAGGAAAAHPAKPSLELPPHPECTPECTPASTPECTPPECTPASTPECTPPECTPPLPRSAPHLSAPPPPPRSAPHLSALPPGPGVHPTPFPRVHPCLISGVHRHSLTQSAPLPHLRSAPHSLPRVHPCLISGVHRHSLPRVHPCLISGVHPLLPFQNAPPPLCGECVPNLGVRPTRCCRHWGRPSTSGPALPVSLRRGRDASGTK